jgi:cytochrome d ubiquinol oxidase subunit I
MVGLGVSFILLTWLMFYYSKKQVLENKRWLLQWGKWWTLMGIVAIEFGWIVAEVGRQPWVVQDLLPTKMGVSNIAAGNVMFSFFGFLILFTLLAIAEVKIMLKVIKQGPEGV